MDLEKAVSGYRDALAASHMHVYLTNECYDQCRHCYMSSEPAGSAKAQQINTNDLFHLLDLFCSDNHGSVAFSGGDPLLHPEIVNILDKASEYSRPEVLTSGFAVSSRNTRNREELLQSLARHRAKLRVPVPGEPFHSLTWTDIEESRQYAIEHGVNPRKLGYKSRKELDCENAWMLLHPIGLLGRLIGRILEKSSAPDVATAMPIGRGNSLPKDLQNLDSPDCTSFASPSVICVSYKGDLQYCLYTCHDGFMNISELQGADNRRDATEYILARLRKDIPFQEMARCDRCFFYR